MPKNSLSLLANRLMEKNHLDQATADKFISNLFEVINMGLQQDKLVKIKGWGTLKVVSVRDRESVDVNTGERIVIEGRDKLNFAPDAVLREIVNKPFAQFETVVVNDGVDFAPIDQEFSDESVKDEEKEKEQTVTPLTTERDASSPTQQEEQRDTEEELNANASAVTAESADEVNEIPEPTKQNELIGGDTVPKVPEKDQHIQEEENSSDTIQEQTEKEKHDRHASGPVVETVSVKKEEKENTLEQEQPVEEQTKTEVQTTNAAVGGHCQESKEVRTENNSDEKEEKVKENNTISTDKSDKEDQKIQTVKVFPRYLIYIIGFLFLILIGGLVGLSYNYGRLVSEYNQMERKLYHTGSTSPGKSSDKVRKTIAKPHSENPVPESGIQKNKVAPPVATGQSAPKAKQTTQPEVKQKAISALPSHSAYDSDPRVRTGAYRIVGTERVITVRKGQTLSGLSQAYLGKGMECYVEALNGIKEVKEGQKLRIPKLELKKKK